MRGFCQWHGVIRPWQPQLPLAWQQVHCTIGRHTCGQLAGTHTGTQPLPVLEKPELQSKSQVCPLHFAVAFGGGVGHALQSVGPHPTLGLGATQLEPQSFSVAEHCGPAPPVPLPAAPALPPVPLAPPALVPPVPAPLAPLLPESPPAPALPAVAVPAAPPAPRPPTPPEPPPALPADVVFPEPALPPRPSAGSSSSPPEFAQHTLSIAAISHG